MIIFIIHSILISEVFMNLGRNFRQIMGILLPSQRLRLALREKFFWEYVKDKIKTKIITSQFKYNLSIVLIVKNAATYTDEWINFHRLVGVNHFYIFDNESEDNLKEVLEPYIKEGIVTYTFWKGKRQQVVVYNYALRKYRFETKWMAFIDDDEFIVPVSETSIIKVLEEINPEYGLCIPWVMYGSSGIKKKTDKLVIEKFIFREDINIKRYISCKQILNPRNTDIVKIHSSFFTNNGPPVDENGNFVNNNKTGIADTTCQSVNKIRINHYHTKSEEEFLLKKSRGDAYSKNNKYVKATIGYFNSMDKNCNNVKDDIMKKYVEPVKSLIRHKN